MKKKFIGLDGLRGWGCLGIVAMHILSNGNYLRIQGISRTIIISWTDFVFIFFIISSFGLCYGYLEKFKTNSIDIKSFYKKRYLKVLPFFSVLVTIGLLIEHSKEALVEAFTELTMLFGFLPKNQLEFLGVSWFLGVIFVFYFFFPFFVSVISNKKMTWLSLLVTIIISQLCALYFFTDKYVQEDFIPRQSFIYCLPFFVIGGLLFHYVEKISFLSNKYKTITLVLFFFTTLMYFILPNNILGLDFQLFKQLVVVSTWVIVSIGTNNWLLENKVIQFFGAISLEIYLSHMIIFRGIERLGLTTIFGDGYLSYFLTFILVILLLIPFIFIVKLLLKQLKAFLIKFSSITKS
ncbi:acyltransferase family protein [Enterococcus sp. LJL90]